MVAHLVDPAHRASARALLEPIVQEMAARRAPGRRAPELLYREGRYGFLELAEWRDRLTAVMLDLPGVAFVDLDEVENRVAIGVFNESARATVAARFAGLGIPRDAVLIPLEEEMIIPEQISPSLSAAAAGTALGALNRPLVGGIQIGYQDPGQVSPAYKSCTLGFVANLDDGRRVLITNSHCSDRSWDLDGGAYFQPHPLIATQYIGFEVRDPNGVSCGFLSVNKCRNADAAAVLIPPTEVEADQGFIARTVYSSYGPGVPGSTDIDPARPRFMINGKAGTPYVNQHLQKMGGNTGWTRGFVTRTCVDASTAGYRKLRCQDYADIYADGGDSGSPVFVDNMDGTVLLSGLLWGSNASKTFIAFSSMAQIHKDLGSLDVVAPGSTPPPPPPVEPGCFDVRGKPIPCD
jgi:hypothetical protein